MNQKCSKCQSFYRPSNMRVLNCERHFVCNSCVPQNEGQFCDQCEIVISESQRDSERQLRSYPIQGVMVNYDKMYNPDAESEFSSNRNCNERTTGWIMCNFLAIVFFFSGLAVAIKTAEKGTGAIMAVVGIVGMVASVYFLCKVRRVDRYLQSSEHQNQDNFIYFKR